MVTEKQEYADLPDDDIPRVVRWPCHLERNSSENRPEPSVRICLIDIDDTNQLILANKRYVKVGLSQLGLYSVGYVFKRNRRIRTLAFEEETFVVDFSDGGWGFDTARGKFDQNNPKIGDLWPAYSGLSYEKYFEDSRVIYFKGSDSPRCLTIPCLEFFYKLYGKSDYVKRTLLTYPIEKAYDMLIVPDVVEPQPGTLQVTMDKHCKDGDVKILGHLRYDPVTRHRIKTLWGQLEKYNTAANSSLPRHIEVPPWFSGMANIKVRGIWLDEQRTRFLGLRITGCSDPQGALIYLDRQNTNLTGSIKRITNSTKWAGGRIKRDKNTLLPITHLVNDISNLYEEVELEDEPFETMGVPRQIKKIIRDTTAERKQRAPVDNDSAQQPNMMATGDAVGNLSGAVKANISLPDKDSNTEDESYTPLSEPDLIMKRVWNALISMVKVGDLLSVESVVDFEGGSEKGGLTRLPVGKPISNNKPLSLTELEWRYLDYEIKSLIRCFMVVKVKTNRGVGYIMEIQRRAHKGNPAEYQALSGLVFVVNSQEELSNWLNYFSTHAALKSGVMSAIASESDNLVKFKDYKHMKMDEVGGLQYSLLSALSVVGLVDKPIRTEVGEKYSRTKKQDVHE